MALPVDKFEKKNCKKMSVHKKIQLIYNIDKAVEKMQKVIKFYSLKLIFGTNLKYYLVSLICE